MAERMNDLLLPVVKGVGSERSYEMLALSLQTLGGSGYLQDYPMEQYLRDAKIDTLYEGTTAIQGMDFFFRKMIRDQFKAVFVLASQITETVKGDDGGQVLAQERELLGRALPEGRGRRRRTGPRRPDARPADARGLPGGRARTRRGTPEWRRGTGCG